MEPKVNIALKAARLAGKEILRFARRKDKLKISEKELFYILTIVSDIYTSSDETFIDYELMKIQKQLILILVKMYLNLYP